MHSAYSVYSDPPLVEEELLQPLRAQRSGAVPFVIGVLWGLGTSFSHLHSIPTLAQGLVFGAAALAFLVADWRWPSTALSRCGVLIAVHAAAALLSGILGEALWGPMVRYALLLPAMAVMLATVRLGEGSVRGLQAGLTLSMMAFVFYHLAFVDMSVLSRAQYRLELFLNPNGVGFISSMAAISLLDMALRRIRSVGKLVSPVTLSLLALMVPCAILCVATKSRTATLVFLVGASVRLYLSLGLTRMFFLSILGVLLIMAVSWEQMGEDLARMFQLYHRERGLAGGTGRFAAWPVIIREIWLPNVLLGVGPGSHLTLTPLVAGVTNAHNGLLMNLAETGLFGTIPLVLILATCGRACIRCRRDSAAHFAIALFIAGFVESLAEIMFFSMGNPGSLLFLLAIASLCGGHIGGGKMQRPAPELVAN